MSGRFREGEIDDVYGLLAAGRWTANEQTVWKSKRGKQMLADMEAALLALPEKRLIHGWLCLPPAPRRGLGRILDIVRPSTQPQVCALGAFAFFKGTALEPYYPERVEDPIDEEDIWYEMGDPQEESIEVAQIHGMTYHMAWTIGDYNDRLRDVTPEERWEKMLKAVRYAMNMGKWVY